MMEVTAIRLSLFNKQGQPEWIECVPDGFLPKNYIRSGAFSKSKRTVSPGDTGLIHENRKKPLRDNLVIST